jgi:two-component system CheB/CheR fusion protein
LRQIREASRAPDATVVAAPDPVERDDLAAVGAAGSAVLGDILALLKERTTHDFQQYKPGTIERRIERRMGLLAMKAGDLAEYLLRLREEPTECVQLGKDLLINVTSFFRDPQVFDTLETLLVPELLQKLPAGQPLRIWVAGCSTGEEAYSIGMICRDAMTAAKRGIKLQIFASDVDPDAIATAREGLYPLEIGDYVPEDRLARYFTREDGKYRIVPTLRGDVVFTVQDVLSDPPFSRMDLVSCRNMLIYLNPGAQAKVISLFHFARREGGC